MKTNIPLTLSVACLVAMLNNPLHAADSQPEKHDDHEHEMEQHGSHEHGAARMTVAVTETGLEIVLETPAANIFGFEHTASSDEEHHIVHEADDKLKDGDKLFSFDKKADCQLDNAEIESNIIAAHDKEKHGDGEHDDHDKHEKHDEHEKEEHDHDKHEKHDEHDHKAGDTHSDVDVTWTFKCNQPDQLTQMETSLFTAFPQGFERLNVEWVNQTSAGAIALKADGVVKFSQ